VLADIRLTITQPKVKQLDFNGKHVKTIISHGVTETNKNIKKIKELLGVTNDKSNKTNSKKCKTN